MMYFDSLYKAIRINPRCSFNVTIIASLSIAVNVTALADNASLSNVSKYEARQLEQHNRQAVQLSQKPQKQYAPTTKTYFALKNTALKRGKTASRPTTSISVRQPQTAAPSRPRIGAHASSRHEAVVAQPEAIAVEATPPIQNQTPITYQSVKVDKNQLNKADQEKFGLANSDQDSVTVPFSIPNTLLLKLKSDISEEEIDALFEEYGFEFIKAYEAIGAIQVKADLNQFYTPKLEDADQNATLMRGLSETMATYGADPRIVSASPDVLLTDKRITNLLSPEVITVNENGSMPEVDDWGVIDIEANQLWSIPGAHDGVVFGVLDVGFNRHEDIVFIDIPDDQGVDDHGNHVSGIACGKHNGVGVRGVLPNCFVRPRSGIHVPITPEGGNIQQFFVKFSQVLSGLNNFINEFDDVRVLNISLGYNWRSNFGINPDAPESGIYRALVQSHGEFLVSVLEILNERNVLVFSAAGNDSTGLEDPIDAKYSSPFNYAALSARSRGIHNALIVEAHDKAGKRAPFSNEKGDISCPGVDVMSTIARVDDNQSPSKTYATMSGTSMASPYCASAAILLSLVTDSTPQEIVECMVSTGPASDSGAPRLKAKAAYERCTNQ